MTNEEWLESLAHNDIPGLRAWFKAEHVESPESGALVQCAQIDREGRERAAEGDTEPENADSRELLDADVRKWCGKYAYQADMVWTWLNRQAAITEEQTRCKWVTASADEIAAWNSRAERTCHDVKPLLSYFKCDSCGMEDMGGTELWIRDGFYRLQKPNYCPNCGCKVVDE